MDEKNWLGEHSGGKPLLNEPAFQDKGVPKNCLVYEAGLNEPLLYEPMFVMTESSFEFAPIGCGVAAIGYDLDFEILRLMGS